MDERHVYRTPAQRLALLPTDRHVRYKCRQDGFWQADWRNDQGKIHHHYLGKDTDGTFAQARADNLAKRIPKPLKHPTTNKPCHHVPHRPLLHGVSCITPSSLHAKEYSHA